MSRRWRRRAAGEDGRRRSRSLEENRVGDRLRARRETGRRRRFALQGGEEEAAFNAKRRRGSYSAIASAPLPSRRVRSVRSCKTHRYSTLCSGARPLRVAPPQSRPHRPLLITMRNTIKSDVLTIYKREKEKLKNMMASIPNRICLTSDLWTSCTSEGYICLTAHFVDDNWKLNSKILNFCHMPPSHTGFDLASRIFQFLKDWKIEQKIFSLTLDNASSNDNMQDILKNDLGTSGWLLCDGEFFHIRCCAHILNLIVRQGLKVASDALHKIRESVKYVKGSEGRMRKFKECIQQLGLESDGSGKQLCLDVSTRWNSTYMMLVSALKYKRAFGNFQSKDPNYKWCPSIDEWERGEKICEFLLPFFDTTNLISGTSYPTSNLYFLQVWKIQRVLTESLQSEDEVIRSRGK